MPHVLKLGVLAEAGDDERRLLELADDYRQKLHASHLAEHREMMEFRNDRFPGLYAALVEQESSAARIAQIERDIKRHHSEQRDRNAVTGEQRADLESARRRRTEAAGRVAEGRKSWHRLLRSYAASFSAAADWKNVKSLQKRESLYERLDWAELLAQAELAARESVENADEDSREQVQRRYESADWQADPSDLRKLAEIMLTRDLERRRLSREYQDRGLHSSIRGEIAAATKPKTGKSGPGFRYRYHDQRPPRPWTKLVLQFAGGVRVGDALAGKGRQLRLTPHPRKNTWIVETELGTKQHPCPVRYLVRAHRPLLEDDVIQRWALVVEHRDDRTSDGRWHRTAHVTLRRDLPGKAGGDGVLCCALSWSRRAEGVEVARFWSATVCERLLVPQWVVDRRLLYDQTQLACDNAANELLAARGINVSGRRITGVGALETWVAAHDDDEQAARRLTTIRRRLRRAADIRRWTIGTIEKIYETAVRRLAARHGSLWLKPLDLTRSKRYDTRDLLREDRLPPESRTVLHAVAPGKLKALLSGSLPDQDDASAPVPEPDWGTARGSDVFTSYVASLGHRGGRWSRCGSDRSKRSAEMMVLP